MCPRILPCTIDSLPFACQLAAATVVAASAIYRHDSICSVRHRLVQEKLPPAPAPSALLCIVRECVTVDHCAGEPEELQFGGSSRLRLALQLQI